MWLRGSWGTSVADLAYKVDQAFARAQVPYFPVAYHGWHTGLEVVVPARLAEVAAAVRQRFEEELPRREPSVGRGSTLAVEPQRLSRQHAKHPWVFLRYREILPDGQRYEALLFRDEQHKHYGRREWLVPAEERNPDLLTLRRLAWRIVTDPELREGLLSDDAELREFWR